MFHNIHLFLIKSLFIHRNWGPGQGHHGRPRRSVSEVVVLPVAAPAAFWFLFRCGKRNSRRSAKHPHHPCKFQFISVIIKPNPPRKTWFFQGGFSHFTKKLWEIFKNFSVLFFYRQTSLCVVLFLRRVSTPRPSMKCAGVRSRAIDSEADAESPETTEGGGGFRRSRKSYWPSRSRRSMIRLSGEPL